MATPRSIPKFGLFDNQLPASHVLMPVYNAEQYIQDSIQSVFKQSFNNIKLLIYSDGCTDNTINIIESFIRTNPHFKDRIHVRHEANNLGVAHARKALRKWSAELNNNAYIFWLDADDQYGYEHFIKDAIQQMQRTGADICLFNFSVKYQDETQINNAAGLLKDKENVANVLQAIRAQAGQVVAPEKFPDLLKFTSLGWTKCYAPSVTLPEPADCPFEDFVYMAALLDAKKITALPPEIEPIAYLRRSDSICGQRKESNFTHDIPTQLQRFFDVVYNVCDGKDDNLKRLLMAQEFVALKLSQYIITLDKLIATGYLGLSQNTSTLFKQKADELNKYVACKIEQVRNACGPQSYRR